MERTDGSTVRVWAEVSVTPHSAEAPYPAAWKARLTAPGGEALLLRGAVTLVLDAGSRRPAEVTHTHLSPGAHPPSWTEIEGVSPPPAADR
ncbi:hypothetical protein [Streptomyces sp. NPDC059452]|uniref:hypothetical protein n=1 Tax=Streptomyces sp. NPDC059452 TaxID=3346835 RepID=UPI00368128BC